MTFANPKRVYEAQFVYNSDIDIQDIINTASDNKKSSSFQLVGEPSERLRNEIADDTNRNILCHAASILKKEIESAKGIETQPLNPANITIDKMKEIVPPNLFQFVQWICGESKQKLLKILSISQSLVMLVQMELRKCQNKSGMQWH